MTSLNDLNQLLQIWIEDESIDDSFLAFINYGIQQAERMIDWPQLYGETTITVGDDGILTIPAQAHKLLGIYSSEQAGGRPNFKFSMRDSEPTAETGGIIQYSAAPYLPVDSTLASVTATITQGSAVVTSSGLFDSTWVGERVLVGTHKDIYEIVSVESTSSMTLSAPVPFTTGSFTILVRPIGMERFRLENRQETIWEGDVLVKYQKLHPSLVIAIDRLKIPAPQTVALKALQNALLTDKYTVDAERLEIAVTKAQSSEVGTSPFSKKKMAYRDRTFSTRSNRRHGRFPRRQR
jgi:hypothetical protein